MRDQDLELFLRHTFSCENGSIPMITFMKQVRKEYIFVNKQFRITYFQYRTNFDWVALIFSAYCFPTTYCSNSYSIIREILRTLDQSSLC